MIYCRTFKTPFGSFRLSASEKGLYRIERLRERKGKMEDKISPPVALLLKKSIRAICLYLSGRRSSFEHLPIDWRGYSPFERKVLQRLREIPQGKLVSYQSLARLAGKPKAQRLVGRILHQNRLPFIIPCHRVVRKDGSLGGFSYGLRWKKRLLKLERASVDKGDG